MQLQETADRLIDGGGFAALHQPGMFDLPAPAVSSGIVSSQGEGGPKTPFRAVHVSERAKLCRHGTCGAGSAQERAQFIRPGI